MGAQHLSRDLVRPSSELEELAQATKKKGIDKSTEPSISLFTDDTAFQYYSLLIVRSISIRFYLAICTRCPPGQIYGRYSLIQQRPKS